MRTVIVWVCVAWMATAAGGCVMRSAHDEVVAKLAATERTLAATRITLDTSQGSLAATTKTLETTQADLKTTKAALATSESSLKLTRTELASAKDAKAALEVRCTRAESDNTRLRQGVTALSTRCQAAAVRLKGAEASLTQLRTSNGRMTALVAQLKQADDAQGTSLKDLEAVLGPLGGDIANLVRQSAELVNGKTPPPPPVTPPPAKTPPVTPPPVTPPPAVTPPATQ